MPLIRGIARTAAVVGTATAVSGRVQRRQQNRWAQQDAEAAPEPEPAYADPAAAPAPAVDPIERLKELGELHAQGVLTDEEFAVQKSKVLNAT